MAKWKTAVEVFLSIKPQKMLAVKSGKEKLDQKSIPAYLKQNATEGRQVERF
jgi:hypothetical protein